MQPPRFHMDGDPWGVRPGGPPPGPPSGPPSGPPPGPPPGLPYGDPPPRRRTARLRGLARWRVVLGVASVLSAIGLGVLLVVLYTATLVPQLPELRRVQHPDFELTSIAYTADGRELARYFLQNRTWVGYDQISPHVVHALLATEDHRFYDHGGVDVFRLVSSALRTAQGELQGGSTLTMQLARNLYEEVGTEQTLDRKVKEIMTALKIERYYTKEEILEMYLNTVPFGYNTFGIEAAAQTYFSKSALLLDLTESATLIGMLKGTTRYNPVRNPTLARQRRNVVLQQMVKQGYLSRVNYVRIRDEELELQFQPPSIATSIAPYFAEYIRNWTDEWARQNGYNLYTDGLRIYTTLDSRLQALAQEAVRQQMEGLQDVADYEWSRSFGAMLSRESAPYVRAREAGQFEPFGYFWRAQRRLVDEYVRGTARYRGLVLQGRSPEQAVADLRRDAAFMDSLRAEKTRLETGLVALDPSTGHVRAWVGGRDFEADQYDKVALARRQPGSTFKPFVYTAAIDFGYSPYLMLQDSVQSYSVPGSSTRWRPTNAGGGASGRMMPLRDGLVYSKNTITAQLTQRLGARQVASFARRMGITSELIAVPSIGLGTVEVTLLEMASAYGTLAADGHHHAPVVVTRIEDANGRVIARFAPPPEKAVSMYTAYTVVDIMRGVIDRGTATRIRSHFGIRADVVGKTGTTQDNADGWFLMMNPDLVAGAWVGFNDRRIAFRTSYWGQGGHNALNVVGAFYRDALDAGLVSTERFTPPAGYRPPVRQPHYDDDFDYRRAAARDGLDEGADPQRYLRDAFAEGLGERPGAARADSLSGRPADALLERDADVEQALRRNAALSPSRIRAAQAPDSLKRNQGTKGRIGW